ncbi:nucleotide exchange factor GrpE [Melissococcus plutonius]|uniref:Protein GrpE n=2 Tax=Melissococcus plutonius TaxID=33970 RepID=F3YB45_MELPT|nr:nucleotide exchange factor GrpE [Melissococcus plutonius]BAL61927.1 heat shock protein GrpE [Melissococcus plutonius DAT561]AIM25148.1 protein GrpE [Melissococcus plutonius S1]KMT25403.1 protein GrpE [Melissococcus plutonius]KMT25443.1 protein GrpE [Melissococcus plutonius]KMT26307.1 protein GrpE [Melissococcus plutonius]
MKKNEKVSSEETETKKTNEQTIESSEEVKAQQNEQEMEAIDDAGVSEVETEESEIEKLQSELSDMEDKFLRAQAEIANMNNRFKNERESLVRYRSQDLGKKILPALDNLERALAIDVTDEQGSSLQKGISMVMTSLQDALKEEGIEEIQATNEKFNPILHQAVQTVPATEEIPKDTIVEVLQKGYKLQERVLRPSMVVVSQ